MTFRSMHAAMTERRQRYLLGPCMNNRHEECPAWKLREIYRKDRLLGMISTPRNVRVYCECPCHASHHT